MSEPVVLEGMSRLVRHTELMSSVSAKVIGGKKGICFMDGDMFYEDLVLVQQCHYFKMSLAQHVFVCMIKNLVSIKRDSKCQNLPVCFCTCSQLL